MLVVFAAAVYGRAREEAHEALRDRLLVRADTLAGLVEVDGPRFEMELPIVEMPEYVDASGRNASGEHGRQLRRRDEVSRWAELGCARTVVTEAGRIERHIHELREAEPIAGCGNALTDGRDEARATGAGFLVRHGQVGRCRSGNHPARPESSARYHR